MQSETLPAGGAIAPLIYQNTCKSQTVSFTIYGYIWNNWYLLFMLPKLILFLLIDPQKFLIVNLSFIF